MFENCPFLSAVMAVLYGSSSPVRAQKGRGNQGHSCGHFTACWGGGEGKGGKKQIDCVSTIVAGKERALGDLCNVKSKINDVPVWKGDKMEVKFNKGWLKREGLQRPFSAARQLPEK